MDFENELLLHIENTPELQGQKLLLVAGLIKDQVTDWAHLEFRELLEAGADHMCQELNADIPPLNLQGMADRMIETETKLIEAGEYNDISLLHAEVSEDEFKQPTLLAEKLAKHFAKENEITEPEDINELVNELTDAIEYGGEHYPDCCRATFEYDGTEWEVIRSEEMANNIARAYVKDMLDSEPEMFNQEWLQGHIYVSDLDKRLIATDDANAYIGDLSDDEVMEQYGEDEEKAKYAEAEESDPKKATELAYNVRERAEEKYSDDIIDRLTNHLTDYLGELGYDLKEKLPDFVQIDTSEAAEEAINIDGWAHFLSHYDGNYETIDDGLVLFRQN